MSPRSVLPAVLFVALLAACSSAGGASSMTSSSSHVRGAVQKGPFAQGATISVQPLDANLDPTGATFATTTTDDRGSFALTLTSPSSYVEVTATGFYYDEVNDALSDAPMSLHAIAKLEPEAALNVNLLTELAAPRVRSLVHAGSSADEALSRAEADVLAALAMPAPAAPTRFAAMDISASADANGALLATSAMLEQLATYGAATSRVAALATLVAKLGAGIATDGALPASGTWQMMRCLIPATIDADKVRANLVAHYAALGETVDPPAIGAFLARPASCGGGDDVINDSCATATPVPVKASAPLICRQSQRPIYDGAGPRRYFALLTTRTGFQFQDWNDGVRTTIYRTCDDASSIVFQYPVPPDGRAESDGPAGAPAFPDLAPGIYWVAFDDMAAGDEMPMCVNDLD